MLQHEQMNERKSLNFDYQRTAWFNDVISIQCLPRKWNSLHDRFTKNNVRRSRCGIRFENHRYHPSSLLYKVLIFYTLIVLITFLSLNEQQQHQRHMSSVFVSSCILVDATITVPITSTTRTITTAKRMNDKYCDCYISKHCINDHYRIASTTKTKSLMLRLILRGGDSVTSTQSTSCCGKHTRQQFKKTIVDWECGMISTKDYPKSFLYSLSVEHGQKVIAPKVLDTDGNDNSTCTIQKKNTNKSIRNYEWVTLSSLNRLYRTQPHRVESLWYDQYSILSTWFNVTHPYSLYKHLHHHHPHHYTNNVYASMITMLLNIQPSWLVPVLKLTPITICASIISIWLSPLLVSFTGITSLLLTNWIGPGFPYHLLIGQTISGLLVMTSILYVIFRLFLQSLCNYIRTVLINEECRLLQQRIPITIIETSSATAATTTTINNNKNWNNDENVENDEDYPT
jgi:hypothetical protein